MFDTRERFDYRECRECGCLQIAEIPADLARHYPPGYYAHSPRGRVRRQSFRRRMQRRSVAAWLRRGNLLDRASKRVWRVPAFADWARIAGIRLESGILDVGSGTGGLLHEMAAFGFTNLTGIDPQIDADLVSADGVRIFKRDLASETGAYALVMFHHSLEHLPDPGATLALAHRVLRRGGCVLVRVPMKDSLAWERYGVDWVQLDAPRHLYLFTEKSFRHLAQRAGFRIAHSTRDSTAFQFWGSELYRRGIPLHSAARSESPRHHFSRRELRGFRRRAQRLNRERRGDAACFYLRAR